MTYVSTLPLSRSSKAKGAALISPSGLCEALKSINILPLGEVEEQEDPALIMIGGRGPYAALPPSILVWSLFPQMCESRISGC